jgi:large-conductance mechanosensitive channel
MKLLDHKVNEQIVAMEYNILLSNVVNILFTTAALFITNNLITYAWQLISCPC